MKKVQLILNVFFYNFHLLDYFFKKILIIYLNPFTWVSNFKKIQNGWIPFTRSMEKNYPNFLDMYKRNNLINGFFVIIITLIIWTLINLILFGFKINYTNVINIFILIISSVTSIGLCYILIFKYDKFYSYHIEFIKLKKYNYPFLSLLFLLFIFAFWIMSTILFVNHAL